MESDAARWRRILVISMTVLVFGSIWGLIEVTLGGFLHAIHLPQKGAIMGGLAISLMALFTTVTGRPSLVPLLGFIAASFKPLDAFILGVPPWSPYITNPAAAIVLEALAFGAIVVVLKKVIDRNLLAKAGAGIMAGYLGYILYAVFASLLGRGIWPTLTFSEKLQFIWTNATAIAIAGALALIVGYYLGRASRPRLHAFQQFHPQLFYSTSFALVIVCLTVLSIYNPGG